MAFAPAAMADIFQSTLPLRRATRMAWVYAWNSIHFNPRSPCGERRAARMDILVRVLFQSMLPLRRATCAACGSKLAWVFQSTLPLRRATRLVQGVRAYRHISIHAPLAESDGPVHAVLRNEFIISIHAPLAESDYNISNEIGATRYFNPRSPCGERPKAGTTGRRWPRFQSTFPLRGATVASLAFCWRLIFQSTFPLRGATRSGRQPVVPHRISIHVPLVGSDGKAGRRCTVSTYFNPRSPCGERPTAQHMAPRPMDFNPRSPCGERQATRPTGTAHPQFQSTFPLRGATGRGRWHDFHRIISIHVPLAGNDSCATLSTCDCRFQSTLPLRGATSGEWTTWASSHYFNPRSPCGERPSDIGSMTEPFDFNPRSPCGERRAAGCSRCAGRYFNPRSPCGERLAHIGLRRDIEGISIHAPLAGNDAWRSAARPPTRNFNPRSPCGERRFRPRCPAWVPDFNPRSPCGERRGCYRLHNMCELISIHAPLAGSDSRFCLTPDIIMISIHAPLAGSDPAGRD